MSMFPRLSGKSRLGVKIPTLNGGINQAQAVNLVEDNQLTDANNMWFYDGILRTRPGFAVSTGIKLYDEAEADDEMGLSWLNSGVEKVHYFDTGVTQLRGNVLYRLFGARVERVVRPYVRLWYVGEEDVAASIPLPIIPTSVDSEKFVNCLVTHYKDILYAYTKILEEDSTPRYEVWRLNMKTGVFWENVDNGLLTIPLTVTNARILNMNSYAGDSVRGHNLINGGFMQRYYMWQTTSEDTEGTGIQQSSALCCKLKFKLKVGSDFTLKYTTSAGVTYEHSVHISDNSGDSEMWSYKNAEDGCLLKVRFVGDSTQWLLVKVNENGAHNTFWTNEKDEGGNYIYKTDTPNLEISGYMELDEEEQDRIFMARRCEWYGGGTEGLYGGARLFVAGSQNIVHYSDREDPTYFPENCYMRIGDTSQNVTALKKQGDMLVIFKEHELYYTVYADGLDITTEDITQGGQYDITAVLDIFPVSLIHGYIGCDCPDSIQLCRNRLVWAVSSGKLYTLVTASANTERSVYEISANIERALSAAGSYELMSAHSCEFENRYVLQVKDKLFIMEYDDNGFTYLASYADSQRAQKAISWYIWTTPEVFDCIAGNGNTIICIKGVGQHALIYDCTPSNEKDMVAHKDYLKNIDGTVNTNINNTVFSIGFKQEDITASLTTKVFDFKNPHIKKSIDQVYIGFGGNGEKSISVKFITDIGETEREFMPDCFDTTPFSAGYISVERFLPMLTHITRLGIKIESAGNLAIDNITINYRLFGSVR